MAVTALPANAVIAVAQTASCEAQGATTCSAGPITTTNGNTFVASVGFCCAAFTSVTDSKGNTYTDVISELVTGGTHGLQQATIAGVGGATHSFTLTGGSAAFFATLSVTEISGAAASPLDQTATDTDATGTSHATAATSTTAQADELLIGFGTSTTLVSYTNDSGAGWTEQTNVTTDVDSEGLITGSKVVSAIGTYTYTYTTSGNAETVHGISTWKSAAAASNRQRCIGCGTDKKVIGE